MAVSLLTIFLFYNPIKCFQDVIGVGAKFIGALKSISVALKLFTLKNMQQIREISFPTLKLTSGAHSLIHLHFFLTAEDLHFLGFSYRFLLFYQLLRFLAIVVISPHHIIILVSKPDILSILMSLTTSHTGKLRLIMSLKIRLTPHSNALRKKIKFTVCLLGTTPIVNFNNRLNLKEALTRTFGIIST